MRRLARIALERSPGEMRAVAVEENGPAFSLFVSRERALDHRSWPGEVYNAIVRAVDPVSRGLFCGLTTGEEVFCNLNKAEKPPALGAHIRAQIVAEAYGEKFAKAKFVQAEPAVISCEVRFASWQASIENTHEIVDKSEDTPEAWGEIDAAFEDALNQTITLEQGGTLHIEATRALTAIDVDMAGRGKARAVNLAAVQAVARQIALRRLAGVVVVDLIGAPKEEAAQSLISAFKAAHSQYDTRRPNLLPINRLGLMQFSLPRVFRAVAVQSDDLSTLLFLWRDLKRRLTADRTASFDVAIARNIEALISATQFDGAGALSQEFGTRFHISAHDALPTNHYKII